MPSTIGTQLKVTVFGQSHSPAIGCVIEGLPDGFTPDMDRLAAFMARRAPGQGPWSTTRREADAVEILSGLNPQGATCGAPLSLIIRNTNTRSNDYANVVATPRPGHADFAAQERWHGNQDVAGGGHFSGRLTAPLCAAGGICLQMLEQRGIDIAAHLLSVADVDDDAFAYLNRSDEATLRDQMATLAGDNDFPTISPDAAEAMRQAIEQARDNGDSVGGVVECVATGMPGGVGSPMFDGIENMLARALFGIPAVKGVEFGRGFASARLTGSQNNDPYEVVDGKVKPTTNNAGGALGGITSGAPIRFAMAIKPTPSIGIEQDSVNLKTTEPAKLTVRGRHDPCIAPRAVPVAQAVCAIVLLDALLSYTPTDKPSRKA